MKAATRVKLAAAILLHISIHAAREGGDASMDPFTAHNLGFQSTPPVKAATKFSAQLCIGKIFQSTPPVKAATCPPDKAAQLRAISIHAAREGGDGSRAFRGEI